jgi:hypothetical protein
VYLPVTHSSLASPGVNQLTLTEAAVCTSRGEGAKLAPAHDNHGSQGDNDILAAPTYDSAGHQLSTSATKAGATTSSTFKVNPLDETIVETRSDNAVVTSWTWTNCEPRLEPDRPLRLERIARRAVQGGRDRHEPRARPAHDDGV